MTNCMSIFHQALPSPSAFRTHYQRRSRPALFRCEPRAGLDAFSPDALAKRHGTARVLVQRSERLTGKGYGAVEETYEEVAFGDFLRGLLANTEHGYLSQLELETLLPPLLDELDFPNFNTVFHRTNLWIGPGGTNSKFHYDEDENLFWQLYGTKRFILAPPAATSCLYPTNVSWGDGYSPIDPKAPDLVAFPRFAEVTCREIILRPGDLLYVPPRWWHDVTSESLSVSVSRLWWPMPLFLRSLVNREIERLRCKLTGERPMEYGPRMGGPRGWLSF